MCCLSVYLFFFFFKQKTAYELRIRDWSSYVCSSDLLDPSFAIIWLLGGACAIGAAWQAKYHRLAALILTSGAGLATCISFVWLSAPDLGVTQLLVEIVTTVLLLLGLRWLPKRVPQM